VGVRGAAIAAAVVCAAAGAGLAVLLLGSGAPASAARPVVASSSIAPGTHLFGDPVTAQLEVVLDPRVVDEDSLRVETRFAPFVRVGAPVVERRADDGAVALRYRWRLECLRLACRGDGLAVHRIRPALLRYRQAGGSSNGLAVDWQPVVVTTRLTADDIAQPRLRWSAALPPATERLSPTLLAALLAVAGLGAAAVAGLLIAPEAARLAVRLWPERDELRGLSPLERAIALLRRANRRGPASRRAALDRLARELRRHGDPSLAVEARGLAWSRRTPDPDEAERLAGSAEGRTTEA
jgi:hypothetical protein